MNAHPSRMIGRRDAFTLIEILIVVAIIAILASIAVYNFLEAQTRARVARVQSDMRSVSVAIESYQVDSYEYPRMNPNLYAREGDESSFLIITPHDNFLYYEIEDGYLEEAEIFLGPGAGCPRSLTTPVAYMSSHPPLDPFIGTLLLRETRAWHDHRRTHCSYFFYNFIGAARQRAAGSWNNNEYAPVVYPFDLRLNGPDGPVFHPDWALLSPGPDRTFAVTNPAGDEPLTSFQFFTTKDNWKAMVDGRHCLYDPTNGTTSSGDIWRTNAGIL